jgi:hypothetical protein
MSEPFNYTRLELIVKDAENITTEGVFYVDDKQAVSIKAGFDMATSSGERAVIIEDLIGREGILPVSIISRDADNEAHGKYRIFGKTGQVAERMTYRHGVPNGPFGLYDEEDGKLIYEGNYEDGEIHGVFTSYDSAGENPIQKRYEHGMRIFGSFVPEL